MRIRRNLGVGPYMGKIGPRFWIIDDDAGYVYEVMSNYPAIQVYAFPDYFGTTPEQYIKNCTAESNELELAIIHGITLGNLPKSEDIYDSNNA